MHPFLLLVLAGFGTFMAVLLVASLRCSGKPAVEEPQATAEPPA